MKATYTYQDKSRNVWRAVEKGAFRNFRHAVASLRKDWARSIRRGKRPSKPGRPPHTRGRNLYRRALRYWSDSAGGIVGPRASVLGQAGNLHEFGGTRRGQHYPARPSGFPTLQRAANRLGQSWNNTIGAA